MNSAKVYIFIFYCNTSKLAAYVWYGPLAFRQIQGAQGLSISPEIHSSQEAGPFCVILFLDALLGFQTNVFALYSYIFGGVQTEHVQL